MEMWIGIFGLFFIVVLFILKKMDNSGKNVNSYFCDASLVYAFKGDLAAKRAALAAARTAASAQRQSMVDYLVGLSADLSTKGEDTLEISLRMRELKNEISQKDWTVTDSVNAKHLLREVDPAALNALNKSFPDYFRNLHSDIFE